MCLLGGSVSRSISTSRPGVLRYSASTTYVGSTGNTAISRNRANEGTAGSHTVSPYLPSPPETATVRSPDNRRLLPPVNVTVPFTGRPSSDTPSAPAAVNVNPSEPLASHRPGTPSTV
jgi:hypothetical protein